MKTIHETPQSSQVANCLLNSPIEYSSSSNLSLIYQQNYLSIEFPRHTTPRHWTVEKDFLFDFGWWPRTNSLK
jgi:hypothetical protein